jgi:hypothetical protein
MLKTLSRVFLMQSKISQTILHCGRLPLLAVFSADFDYWMQNRNPEE